VGKTGLRYAGRMREGLSGGRGKAERGAGTGVRLGARGRPGIGSVVDGRRPLILGSLLIAIII
jgi:hypothetical protein